MYYAHVMYSRLSNISAAMFRRPFQALIKKCSTFFFLALKVIMLLTKVIKGKILF
jgi:hypothetical protein